MAELGGRFIVEALEKLTAGQLSAPIQPEDGVTYAAKLAKGVIIA